MIEGNIFLQAHDEKQGMEAIREYNRKLLGNILPLHVTKHFLKMRRTKREVEIPLPPTLPSSSKLTPKWLKNNRIFYLGLVLCRVP